MNHLRSSAKWTNASRTIGDGQPIVNKNKINIHNTYVFIVEPDTTHVHHIFILFKLYMQPL